jgi:hypothetical protein
MCEEGKACEPDYCKTCGGRWVSTVKDYVQQLQYGEVNVIVHDGKVVQVEKTEKVRF